MKAYSCSIWFYSKDPNPGHRYTQACISLQISCGFGFSIHALGEETLLLDSSPQFARDYLMTEVDIFRPEEVSSWADVGEDGVLQARLMVGQLVGARASGATVKARKLLHSVSLESW